MVVRSHLIALTLVTLVPILLVSAIGAAWLIHRERTTFEQRVVETNHTLASIVDDRLTGYINTLTAIAAGDTLRKNDIERFRREVDHILATQPDWFNIVLLSPSGAQLVNARERDPRRLMRAAEMETVQQALTKTRAAVTPVIIGRVTGHAGIAIRVPVMDGETVRYVLSATLDASAFARLMSAQRLPSEWVGAIIDQNDRFVTRTMDPAGSVGKRASRSVVEARARAPEGWQRVETVDGSEVYFAHALSRVSGWTVALAVPAATFNEPIVEMAMWYGAYVVGALLFALMLAIPFSRRISEPIADLAARARNIDAEPAAGAAEKSGLSEVRELATVLTTTRATVREREERLFESLNQLQVTHDQLRKANEELREEHRKKDDFIATLAHELRNPLAPLRTGLYVLQHRTAPDVIEKTVDMMDRQLSHIVRLIEDLLDVSRFARGKIVLRRQPVTLQAVLRTAMDASKPFVDAGGQSLTVDIPDEPIWINADATRVSQIITNVINNAVKFTPADGTISVRVARVDSSVAVRISDTGMGIPADVLPHIFDIFVQGKNDGAHEHKSGLGLGLYLAKLLVDMHDGDIIAMSEGSGHGATFVIRLPLYLQGIQEIPATGTKPAGQTRTSRTVLVVDDNRDAADSLAMALRVSGHSVVTAYGGREAVEIAPRIAAHLVLLDIGMPEVDGYEVCRRLRRMSGYAHTKIFAVTGWGAPSDRKSASDAGFDGHLTKPVAYADVEALMN